MTWVENYKILTLEGFEKSLKKNLPLEVRKIFNRKLDYLSTNPDHPSLNTKQLTVGLQTLKKLEVDKVWEFRINTSFRCVFYTRSSDKSIILALAGNHDLVNKKFPK